MKNYLQRCCSLSMIPLIKTIFFSNTVSNRKRSMREWWLQTIRTEWKTAPQLPLCVYRVQTFMDVLDYGRHTDTCSSRIFYLQTNTNLMQNVRIYSKCFWQIGNYFVPWMWTKPAPHLSLSRWQDTVNHIDHTDQIRLSHCNRFTSWFTLQSTVMWDFPRAVWKGDCQHLN